jgi:hypothetical protein
LEDVEVLVESAEAFELLADQAGLIAVQRVENVSHDLYDLAELIRQLLLDHAEHLLLHRGELIEHELGDDLALSDRTGQAPIDEWPVPREHQFRFGRRTTGDRDCR